MQTDGGKPEHLRSKFIASVAIAVAGLALTGCGAGQSPEVPPTPDTSYSSSEVPTNSSPAEELWAPTPDSTKLIQNRTGNLVDNDTLSKASGIYNLLTLRPEFFLTDTGNADVSKFSAVAADVVEQYSIVMKSPDFYPLPERLVTLFEQDGSNNMDETRAEFEKYLEGLGIGVDYKWDPNNTGIGGKPLTEDQKQSPALQNAMRGIAQAFAQTSSQTLSGVQAVHFGQIDGNRDDILASTKHNFKTGRSSISFNVPPLDELGYEVAAGSTVHELSHVRQLTSPQTSLLAVIGFPALNPEGFVYGSQSENMLADGNYPGVSTLSGWECNEAGSIAFSTPLSAENPEEDLATTRETLERPYLLFTCPEAGTGETIRIKASLAAANLPPSEHQRIRLMITAAGLTSLADYLSSPENSKQLGDAVNLLQQIT